MTLASGARLGPYEILSPLGAGGMGEVYRARDTRLERDVAIKVLPERLASDPDSLARFEREAKAVAALSHPNILAIHDFGSSGNIVYAVTELLEGETLRDRLNASAIPARKAIEYARQISHGLAAAHDRGIVHRDLKPDNLFLTRDGLVKILDFGLASQERPRASGSDPTLVPTGHGTTDPGTVLGTVGYMSPEQVRGKPFDHRSDLFSLGVVLYEMILGKRAFQRDSAVETMMAILQDDPRLPGRDMPAGLEEIVTHCLEKTPEERFQSARDLAFALQVLERDSSTSRSEPLPSALSEARTPSGGSPAAVERPSIAVLPLRNLSTDPENEYFSDGMTEEVIGALTKIEDLRVASRTSSFAFKGKSEDVRKIGERLNVRTILEGSVRRSGARIRISAQLVNVIDGYQLWSDHYDGDMSDVFAVQDEIARAIAGALKVRLLPAEQAALVSPGTRDVEAYNAYLKGRYFFGQRAAKKAVAQFEAAIARDPSYAAAYTGLADSFGIFAFYGGIPTREAFARARAAATQAQKIDPDSADVHVSLGIIEHYFGWDLEREEGLLEKAIALAPRSAEGYSWLGLLQGIQGRSEAGVQAARKATKLEPLSANAQTNVGWPLYIGRRHDEAVAEFRKALHIDPNAMYPLWAVGMCYQSMGASQEAITAYERSVMVTRRELSWPVALLGGAYAAAGREADARRVLGELEEWSAQEYVPPMHVALVHLGLGNHDAVFDCLDRAVTERNAFCWWIRYSPIYDSLRSDSRFEALLGRIKPE
jgi:eukaryotic-like serine/threonine-protein kinase